MKEPLEIKIGGLKCDNPKCDYTNMDIKAEDYEKWVEAKCPKCGEILLTKKDYNNTRFLFGIVDLAKKIYPKRKKNNEKGTEKEAAMTVEMNGSGNMNIHIEEL